MKNTSAPKTIKEASAHFRRASGAVENVFCSYCACKRLQSRIMFFLFLVCKVELRCFRAVSDCSVVYLLSVMGLKQLNNTSKEINAIAELSEQCRAGLYLSISGLDTFTKSLKPGTNQCVQFEQVCPSAPTLTTLTVFYCHWHLCSI